VLVTIIVIVRPAGGGPGDQVWVPVDQPVEEAVIAVDGAVAAAPGGASGGRRRPTAQSPLVDPLAVRPDLHLGPKARNLVAKVADDVPVLRCMVRHLCYVLANLTMRNQVMCDKALSLKQASVSLMLNENFEVEADVWKKLRLKEVYISQRS